MSRRFIHLFGVIVKLCWVNHWEGSLLLVCRDNQLGVYILPIPVIERQFEVVKGPMQCPVEHQRQEVEHPIAETGQALPEVQMDFHLVKWK